MAATERLSLLIESQTRGSRDVNKLAEELNKVSSIAERSNQRVEKSSKAATDQLSQVSGKIRSAISDPMGAATQVVGGFTSKLGLMGVVVGGAALGIGALAGAAFGFMRKMGELTDMMGDFAARTGLTIDQVDKLRAMSAIAGVNMGALERSGGQLAQSLLDAGAGGEKLRGALRDLNVETITATGKQREMGPIIWDTLKALSAVTSQTELAAKANTILGISGKELVPLIRDYEELAERVERLGIGQDAKLLEGFDETRERMAELGERWGRLTRQLGVPVKAVVDLILSVTKPGEVKPKFFTRTGVPDLSAEAGFIQRIQGQRAQSVRDQQQALAAGFRERFALTPEGMTRRLADLEIEVAEAIRKLGSGSLNAETFREVQSQYGSLLGERTRLKAALKPGEPPIPAADIHGFMNPFAKPFDVTGARFQQSLGAVPGVPFFGTAPGTNMAEIDPARGAEIVANLTKRRVDLMQQALSYEVQINQLMAGPGGEVAAINESAALRIETAQRIYEITKDQSQLQLETAAAIAEREIALLQLRKQGMDEYRNSVVNAFDALISGGQGGLSSFFRSQGLGSLRQIVGNVADQTYQPGLLTLPGQGTAETPSLLGRLLSGTPFGLDPADATIDNTRATIENTAALRGSSIGVSGLPGGVFQGAGGPLGTIFSALGGKGGLSKIPLGASQTANTLGVMGIGGNAATSVGGALGSASGFLGTLGAVMPWVGVGLAGASIIASLLPNPKQERAKEIELRIESARITVEGPAEFHLAGGAGEAFDYDVTGQTRAFKMSDSDIADSVVRASQSGHRVNEEMRSAALG